MIAPSIEALLSRKQRTDSTHPVAKRLNDVPVLGHLIRSWARATKAEVPQSLWASLPPVAAA